MTTRRFVVAAWLTCGFAIAALADDAALKEAKKLYADRQYAAAQTKLSGIDRAKLSADEALDFDDLLSELPEALRLNRRAGEDLAAADTAYAAKRWPDAERLYQAVAENPHAPRDMQDKAGRNLRLIAKERGDAAQTIGKPGESLSVMTPVSSTNGTHGGSTAAPTMAPAMQQAPTAAGGAPMAQLSQSTSPPVSSQAPGVTPRTVVDELRERDTLLWQRAVSKMNQAVERAGESLAQGDHADARAAAAQAIQIVEAARAYAQPAQYDAALAVAQACQQRVEDEIALADADAANRQRAEVLDAITRSREAQEQQRIEKVSQLLETARQLHKEQRHREAAETMNQLLAIDPANAEGKYLQEAYEDFAARAENLAIQTVAERETQGIFTQTEETKIPWTSDILYPRNWLEIIGRPTRRSESGGLPTEDLELNRKLEDKQPEVNFEEQPLDQVITFLTDLNKLNISVDWQDLETNSIERDKPVTIKLRDVTLKTALNEILSQVGGETVLAFQVGDGLLRIATKEKLDRDRFILVYDIRDLIVNIPRFTEAPRIDIQQASQGGGGGGGQNIFGGGGGGQEDEEEEQGTGPGEENPRVTQLIDIIRTTVEPDSWRETGGGQGAIRELNGQLIVYNTSDSHRQVKDLLGQLRDTRALMIGVESRFLIVTSNFLEEMGVDLDFVFNQGEAGFDRGFNNGAPLIDPFTGAPILIPRQFSRAGFSPASPALGNPFPQIGAAQNFGRAAFVPQPGGVLPGWDELTPVGFQQGSLGLVDPGQINTGIPGSISQAAGFGPAMSIAGTFLDNLQVDFLIRATQANRRSSIAQSPKLMMFNGQRAYVAVSRTRQYVGGLTAQVAEGAVAATPQVQNAASGVVLDVEGTISADRRYVTITVRTDLAEEPSFERFETQGRSGSSPSLFIQLTDQEIRTIRTTVSVPDGGTVLLGGLKQLGEVDYDAGVPVLSKIPVLKRAFTNTTSVKDLQTLLILLKTKIHIQKEAEDEAFPTFSSSE